MSWEGVGVFWGKLSDSSREFEEGVGGWRRSGWPDQQHTSFSLDLTFKD